MAQYKTFNNMYKEEETENNQPEVFKVSSLADRANLILNNHFLIIDNYTDWCAPCKEIAPRFALLSQKYKDKCFFAKENVEEQYGKWPRNIQGVPCFHFYIDGKFQNDMIVVGADLDKVEYNIQQLLNL